MPTSAGTARLTPVVRAVMRAALPGASFGPDPTLSWPSFEVRIDPQYYVAGSWVTDAQGSRTVQIFLSYDTWEVRRDTGVGRPHILRLGYDSGWCTVDVRGFG